MTVDLALHDCGPCLTAGPAVRDHLPPWLSPDVAAMMLRRMDRGAADYGADLVIGWEHALIEALQEALDLIIYLIAAGAPEGLIRDAAAMAATVAGLARARGVGLGHLEVQPPPRKPLAPVEP
jgi:hypothetical protein